MSAANQEAWMRTRSVGSKLLIGPIVCSLLLACGGSAPGADPSPTPTPTASPSIGGAGGGGVTGGGGGAGGAGGGGNTVTYMWTETVDRSAPGVFDIVHQEYKAVAQVTLTHVDIYSWEITGRAEVSGVFTEDFKSDCAHYTDDAAGRGTVDVTGGLEASDGAYQFYVDILGATGTNATVRDDSACGGPNNAETTEWSIGSTTQGGDGDYTDIHHITGTWTRPREGGTETLTWDLTLPD
jgi:hypothetical protein